MLDSFSRLNISSYHVHRSTRWKKTGKDVRSIRGILDALGGISRAIAIAKQKANIPLFTIRFASKTFFSLGETLLCHKP